MSQADIRTPRVSFEDKIGQAVHVGDCIVYGSALGRCAALRIGKVLGIETVERDYRGPEWSIRVRGVDDTASFLGKRLCAAGTLQYPDRIIRLSAVPDDIAQLLENA